MKRRLSVALLIVQMITKLSGKSSLQTYLDQLLNQPIRSLELDLVGTNQREQAIRKTGHGQPSCRASSACSLLRSSRGSCRPWSSVPSFHKEPTHLTKII